ncbi:hypothetical protein CLU79DRAFT_857856 [Phycomyces nitens]|nr:hypothetical protein CLU79DRAFT_857856 [Phycomyces nitens]
MLAFTTSNTATFALAPLGTSVPLSVSSEALESLDVSPVKASLAVGAACAAIAAPLFFQAVARAPATPSAVPSATPTLRVFRVAAQVSGRKRKHSEITGGDEEVGRPTSRRRIGEYVLSSDVSSENAPLVNIPSDSASLEEVPAPRGVKRTRDIDADELEQVYTRVKARYDAGPVLAHPFRSVPLDLCTWVVRREHMLELEDLYRDMTVAREEFIKQQQQQQQTPPSPVEEVGQASTSQQPGQETSPPSGPSEEVNTSGISEEPAGQEASPPSGPSEEIDTNGVSGELAGQPTPWEKAVNVAAAVKRFFSL